MYFVLNGCTCPPCDFTLMEHALTAETLLWETSAWEVTFDSREAQSIPSKKTLSGRPRPSACIEALLTSKRSHLPACKPEHRHEQPQGLQHLSHTRVRP